MLFEDTVAELSGASAPIFLLQKPAAGPLSSRNTAEVRSYRRQWTPLHLDVVVADSNPRSSAPSGPVSGQKGRSRSFVGGGKRAWSDPFGNGFCLLQWLGRGYDGESSGPTP